MTTSFRRSAVLLIVSCAAAAPLGAAGKMQTRHVFVHVVDQRGGPVGDLTAADFQLTEGGVARVVSRAGPAKDPMRIALFLDTSDAAAPALSHMRAGAIAFLAALPPEDEVLLVTTGRQARVRVPPTTDRHKLKDAAGGLFGDGAGTVLMDGLMEVDDRFFKKTDDRWPVFVIFTSDGTESSAGAREKEFNTWNVAIGARGVTVHAFVFKTGKGGGMPDVVANNLTRDTGGRYDMSTEFKAIDVAVARTGVRLEIADRRTTR